MTRALALQRQSERTRAAADECVRQALQALNLAAYAAVRAAADAGDPRRLDLIRLAEVTDTLAEGRA
ncbi:hypothetical protein D1114_07205 [Cereibacter sphaeroides]|uniref:Uncharacterized protein n=1 Tax=Cereibacter sphaeroides TaxID=1063 RepID=A0AAX1UP13_CERSP|nr:hypothetical protein [Cereibacter sphaeroides]RHZ96489.1 hypothetical protein D1114_07205 [Cereibacter sphaeroides]